MLELYICEVNTQAHIYRNRRLISETTVLVSTMRLDVRSDLTIIAAIIANGEH